MLPTFWQARMTIGLDALRRRANEFGPALRKALEAGVSDAMVFELMRDDAEKDRMALTISVVNAVHSPGALTCWLAFSNDPEWCNRFRRLGIPMVEARIKLSANVLSIEGAAYPERKGMDPVSLGNQPMLTFRGVDLDAPGTPRSDPSRVPGYLQWLTAPDVALQSEDVAALQEPWEPPRGEVRKLDPHGRVTLEVQASAWPGLAEVFQTAAPGAVWKLKPVWSGRFLEKKDPGRQAAQAPDARSSPYGPVQRPRISRFRSASIFGAPVFRFEEVEVVGFRITLPASKIERLQDLVKPLNFHRDVDGMVADFRWRVATTTVVIELLYYGRMKSHAPAEPLRSDDYMCQHELLVRLLVGKVDDDGSQAREASLFIPAIFVDNPWSKVVGRETQGLSKELAEFCITDEQGEFCSLEMDGAHPSQSIQPLTKVVHVRLPSQFDRGMPRPLLDLTYPSELAPSDDNFEHVDLGTVLDEMVFGNSQWRQSDFGERDFRRSFAKQAMSGGFNGFRSVQVSPVDGRGLPPAWIHGEIKVRNFKAHFPHGVATLKFSKGSRQAGDPWLALCDILEEEEFSLPSGDWYRLKTSMDLRIKSSLDW